MGYEDSVQKALDYIEAYLEEELDPAAVAEESHLSLAQLYRVFYALTGHPVKDYIRKRRMSVAAGHLRNSKRTVEELAWDSGFESYHSFAKVFKKIVGLTPAAYRKADIFFSFEPIRLQERVSYLEDREQSERYPDVRVIRLTAGKSFSYLHLSEREEGMENEAYRVVTEKLATCGARTASAAKARIFGHNVDPPEAAGERLRFGYKVQIIGEEPLDGIRGFEEEPFSGGLYAVRKIAAKSPELIQEGWDRLLAEWLPKSAFELGDPPFLEEFIAYNGKVARMNLHLPVRRKLRNEPIEIVEKTSAIAYFFRGQGLNAQEIAERQLIDGYENNPDIESAARRGRYYMSYPFGERETESYWWENGILIPEPEAGKLSGLESKRMEAGTYACCLSKAYGLLTGTLESMYRWVAVSGSYRLDDERQWFAEYHVTEGMNIERDAIVKVYLPILSGEGT